MRALAGILGLVASFLVAPALAETLAQALPAAAAGAVAWGLARALLPFARKVQNEDPPREA